MCSPSMHAFPYCITFWSTYVGSCTNVIISKEQHSEENPRVNGMWLNARAYWTGSHFYSNLLICLNILYNFDTMNTCINFTNKMFVSFKLRRCLIWQVSCATFLLNTWAQMKWTDMTFFSAKSNLITFFFQFITGYQQSFETGGKKIQPI